MLCDVHAPVMAERPRVILHNSVSLDGSLTHFEPNMALHYQIAGGYAPDAHLIGSNTVKTGNQLYGDGIPPEAPEDFEPPQRDSHLPYWVIPDTRGSLQGELHTCRRFEFCRDVIVLVAEETPKDYIAHLTERRYRYHVVGERHADIGKALALLAEQYDMHTVLADTGRILGNHLLNERLVSEISLLVHPVIVGTNGSPMFADVAASMTMTLQRSETFDGGHLWLVYDVV